MPLRLLALCAALILATPLSAQQAAQHAGRAQLQNAVAQELPVYGFRDVDVRDLSTLQLTQINHLVNSSRSASRIRGGIGVVLGDSFIRNLFR